MGRLKGCVWVLVGGASLAIILIVVVIIGNLYVLGESLEEPPPRTATVGDVGTCAFGGPPVDQCCPPTLREPAAATTDIIRDCARWWSNLPTEPARPAIDWEAVKAELCARGQTYATDLINTGVDPAC